MIEFDLQIDNVSAVENTILHPNLAKDAMVMSDGSYIFAYENGYYDKDDFQLVMVDTRHKDTYGTNIFPIPYFLGCDGKNTRFDILNDTKGEHIKIHCEANSKVL
ncbi:MAG: hypothetical protein HRK26_01565 [Rickettsiaceae bacterium H1]|nr:hypothetical protein [Rickettsiaceae bacterium H1]